VQFTKFGPTGLTVSRVVLGTGIFGKQTDGQESHRMLDTAAQAGINFIDTADISVERRPVPDTVDCHIDRVGIFVHKVLVRRRAAVLSPRFPLGPDFDPPTSRPYP
jgi:diketogulonate reductase-like aldo/keto reductase